MLEPVPVPVRAPVLVPEPEPVPGMTLAADRGTPRFVGGGGEITVRGTMPSLEGDGAGWPPPELAAMVEVVAQRVAPKPGTADVPAHGDLDGWGRPAGSEASRRRLGVTASVTGVTGGVCPGVAVDVDGDWIGSGAEAGALHVSSLDCSCNCSVETPWSLAWSATGRIAAAGSCEQSLICSMPP